MFNHILTSIIGSHPRIQDAIKYFEDEGRIIAVVADGLGSRMKSADGARLICKLVVEEFKSKDLPLHSADIDSPKMWYEHLERQGYNHDDYCTTCSFVVIDKKTKQMNIGQIGDSPVFFTCDGKPIEELRHEKEFSNVTDCLGGKTINSFALYNHVYSSGVKILLTTDGFGDELDSSRLEPLFDYMVTKYQNFTRKSRSRRFTKEMRTTIGNVNSDDKSAIFIWSA